MIITKKKKKVIARRKKVIGRKQSWEELGEGSVIKVWLTRS